MLHLYEFIKNFITESRIELVELAKQREGLNKEAGGKCGWFATADSFIEFLHSPAGSKMAKKYSEDLIRYIYTETANFADQDGFKWNTCPIIIDGKREIMGIRRRYHYVLDYILKHKQKFGLKVKMELHDGFGTRADKGEGYEGELKSQIINLLNFIEQYKNFKNLSTLVRQSKSFDDCIKDMFDGGAFDNILNALEKNPNLNLDRVIQLTGKKDTRRNKNNQIINTSTFEINTDNIKDVLKESGSIISDITIDAGVGDPTFISVKMKESQLTGINVRALDNELVYNYITNKQTNKLGKEFDNIRSFIECFGVSFDDLMNKYKELEETGKCDTELKLLDNYDKKSLGVCIQKMVGGNYWYAKKDHAVFVGCEDAGFEFSIEKAYLAKNPSKILYIKGTINDISCRFVFRTSGDASFGNLPYRLFIETDVKGLINKLAEKK